MTTLCNSNQAPQPIAGFINQFKSITSCMYSWQGGVILFV